MIGNELMKRLLTELASNKDLTRHLVRCAEWTVDELHYCHFKPIPLKPTEVKEYEEIPLDDRMLLSNQYFDIHHGIRTYYNLIRKVRNENKAIYDWLLECKRLLQEDGQLDRVKLIDQKLEEVTVEQLHDFEKRKISDGIDA